MRKTPAPPSDIFQFISYNKTTGVFTWSALVGGSSSIGKRAGYVDYEGYERIRFRGVRYAGHSLAWLHETGEWIVDGIDHKNLVKPDNSFSNLRKATKAQNTANSAKLPNTSSRFKGVTWNRKCGAWQAQIQARGSRKYLGMFESEEAAADAYRREATKVFGEYARFE